MLRVIAIVALAAFVPVPASAGTLKGLPPVQTVGVKVPLKLISVSIGTPSQEPETDEGEWLDPPQEWPGDGDTGCPDCWEPPGGSGGGDDPPQGSGPDDPPSP